MSDSHLRADEEEMSAYPAPLDLLQKFRLVFNQFAICIATGFVQSDGFFLGLDIVPQCVNSLLDTKALFRAAVGGTDIDITPAHD
jgi:hypothetical protein